MRSCRVAVVVPFVLSCLFGAVSIGAAQSTADDPLPAHPLLQMLVPPVSESIIVTLSEEQLAELQQWMRDFAAWQEWADKWLNRRQPGKWAYFVERNKKPDPPAWLDDDVCALLGDDTQISQACNLLASWRHDPVTARNTQLAAAAQQKQETVTKTSWWQHVHLDGLWSTTQSNVTVFGLFGAHLTTEVAGRLQVFVAPGIMLVSVPGLFGNRELWPATDWGVSYRLFGVGRSTVHFNLVHAWMLAGGVNVLHPNMTLAGFSVSFKPRSR
jgi:hypothetical protein